VPAVSSNTPETSPPDDAATLPSRGARARWAAIFLALAIGLFAADMGIKYLAFTHVAGVPLMLHRGDDGTTVVQMTTPDGERITLPRGPSNHPATAIPKHDAITVVPSVLALRLTLNTGAVFGLGKGKQWLFVLFSIAATALIGRAFWKTPRGWWLFRTALAMILAGALGNLYDRVRYGAVRDMFYLFPEVKLPFGLTWPGGAEHVYPWIFNLADAALVVGVIVLFVIVWRHGWPTQTPEASQD